VRTATIEQTIELPKGVYKFEHKPSGVIYCAFNDENGKRHGLGRLDSKLTDRFVALIDRLKAGTVLDCATRIAKPRSFAKGTVGDFIEQYLGHREYRETADNTKANYRPLCEFLRFWYGDESMKSIDEDILRTIQDAVEKGEAPVNAELARKMGAGPLLSGKSTADRVVGMFGRIWNFAIEYCKFRPRCVNPADLVKNIHEGESWRRWPEHIIAKYLDGATDREALALLLLLYTGQRIGDCCEMKCSAFDGKHITVKKQQKKRNQKKAGAGYVRVRVLKPLLDMMRKCGVVPGADGYIATNAHGGKYTRRTMRNVIHDRLVAIGEAPETGDSEYVPHGLRASAASRLYEATRNVELVRAVTGHDTDTVWRYIQEIHQEQLSDAAMDQLETYLEESKVIEMTPRRRAA